MTIARAGVVYGRMRKRAEMFFPTFLAVLFIAAAAHAQCEFSAGRGAKLRVPMVRAFEECFADDVNATTEAGVPACSPVKAVPRRYVCSETGESCQSDGDCYTQWCGAYLTPYPNDYFYCSVDGDCPASPYSNETCESHPGNVCAAEAGTRSAGHSFAPGGSCTLWASSRVEKQCGRLTDGAGTSLGLPARACHVTTLTARCRRILQADGATPIDVRWGDGGWSLKTTTRATFDDEAAGDVTQVDFPVSFAFGDPDRGSIELQTTTAEALVAILGTAGAALPPCTHLQPIDARVADPDANVFAKVGLATEP